MEANFKAKEITLIADFISSINNLIHGKFILADVKINEVLNKIELSEELFHFIQEQMIGFNFEKELRKAEIKNRFNGGTFKLPSSEQESIALAFCLLVEFDCKHIDFYEFIKENFPTLDNRGDYNAFAQIVLTPLRDSIAKYFGLSKDDNTSVLKELESKVQEEIQEEERNQEEMLVEKSEEDTLFEELEKIEKHLLTLVENDIKIKPDLKEDIAFILKTMVYANKYKDFKILNALLVSFEHLTKKVHSIKFVYDELKQLVLNYYEKNKKLE